MSDDDAKVTTVDAARTAQVGGWRAAVCVDANGHESLWLLAPDPGQDHGCACRSCAPHEQVP